ncbi:histidine phosphatase family protein [Candidatus Woesearchaeota archaeon]|jgi:broad specificity phosphatase PhoE|nr:histidine phosphatase family protein [Candidatus Woesearchaeota archaeon]MBT4322257.1 histidine phosphatase family protein [Candidatus Woesearchaeota archaeon]MBT4631277.1 histidine phosphatase family protein [Candidatus Woesearchaeota archaeon]
MKLILVRHGKTRENEKRISQGQKYGTLSKEGLAQINLLVERLKDVKIDFIYTSDLARANRTANSIAKYHPEVKIKKDKLLREIDHGEFSGKMVTPEDWLKLPGEKFGEKRSPGGERLLDVLERVKKFYQKILKKHGEETVLVVTHGGVIYCFRSIFENLPLWKLRERPRAIANTSISEFEITKDGEISTICLGCDRHLLK